MNIVLNKLSLDVNKSGTQANIVAKEGDIQSRAVIITFNKNGQIYNVEDGNTAIIRAKKPDGTVIYNNATVEDGKVYFLFTSQYCTSVGKVTLEVQILDSDNHVLYTPKFLLIVENNIYDDSEIESTNEYTQLTESINQAQSAITIAQALSLIKYVTALPTTGDSKYLYILYETKKLYELSGLPSQFTSAAEYNGWKNYYGDNAKACMFKTTDPDHPFILFYGIELEIETYNNPGMYTLKGIMSNTQAIEYVYNANTKQWVAEAPITGLSVGDNIIKGESYTGSDSAWEGYYVIDDSFEATYAKLYGYLWCIGEFTMVNRLNTVTYTESDNLFNIYDSVDLPLPYGVPYVYDSDFNQYIEVTDADLKNRVAIIENIIATLQNGKQDKLIEGSNISINSSNVISAIDTTYTAGDNITISENNVISATGGGSGSSDTLYIEYSKENNVWTCNKTFPEISSAIADGKKIIPVVLDNNYTLLGDVYYQFTGNNTLSIQMEISSAATSIVIYNIVHQYINSTESITVNTSNSTLQSQLTAGSGISISNNTVSLPSVTDNDVGKVLSVVENAIDTGEVDEDDDPIYEYTYTWEKTKTIGRINLILNNTATSVVTSKINGVSATANEILDYLGDNENNITIFANIGFQGPSWTMKAPVSYQGSSANIIGILSNGYLLSITIYRSGAFVIDKYYELANYDNGDTEEY